MPKAHEPTWQELVMGQVDATFAARRTDKARFRDLRTRVPAMTATLVYDAAASRDMSVAAYMRRAVLAFVAQDLDLDLVDLLADEPPTRLKSDGLNADRQLGGQGHGKWRIVGLR